jgi:glycosyltransferase involved in cell wall biosynthesis
MISVITATISGREKFLQEARNSVAAQTYPGRVEHLVERDHAGEGPSVCRNRAVARARGEWLSFLDDDDYFLPQHLEHLFNEAMEHGADVVWPWYRVEGGRDPFPAFRGRQWDPAVPHQFPITALVRTDLFSGFDTVPDGAVDKHGQRAGEDWRLWLALSTAGAVFHHTPEITWVWRHHGRNTSGLPSRVR